MNSLVVGGIAFACRFWRCRGRPDFACEGSKRYLSDESQKVVTLGTGLIGTLAALVLGLLIASASSSFDAQRRGFQQMSFNLVVLDRTLAQYGPEAKDARDELRRWSSLRLIASGPTTLRSRLGLANPERSSMSERSWIEFAHCHPRTIDSAVSPVPSPGDQLGVGKNAVATE